MPRVVATRQKLVIGHDVLDRTGSVAANFILKYYNVTWLPDSGVRFRRHDQCERLKVRCDFETGFVPPVWNNLPDASWPAFRCDRPQNISHVLPAETGRRREFLEVRVNLDSSSLGLDGGFPFRLGKQDSATKVDPRR